jgi:hypothetical protein
MCNNYTVLRSLLFASLFLISEGAFGQGITSERLDSTISIFWNSMLKVRIKILDPEEPDVKRQNTVLTLFSDESGSQRIIFRDSLFAYMLQFKMMDLNGDGIKDLLIYNVNNGQENLSYHLYLVDQKSGRLTRIKGFEKVFNPYYDQSRCLIYGFESFEKKLILRHYLITKKGELVLAY